jgi:phosphoesterase RecJ-like protein
MTNQHCSIDWTPWRTLLEQHQRFVITSHVRPDCDALGSELAMAAVLRSLGKQVRIINADPTPPRLAFIDPAESIEVLGRDVVAADIEQNDVILVLDTSAWRQLGSMADVIRQTKCQIVVIDHHASEGQLQAQMYKDDQSEATGRLVYDLARYLDVPITPDIARSLFAAIATDTGWFRFSSTTASTYQTVGELVAHGARPQEIYRDLYERDSISRARLRGIVLSRLVTEIDGRLAHTHVLAKDFADTGALPSETEDFVNMGLAIAGTEVAVMLTEQPVGTVKVSFRSSDSVDCSELAATFGGGGHRAAAGATLEEPFHAAQLRVLDAVRRVVSGTA